MSIIIHNQKHFRASNDSIEINNSIEKNSINLIEQANHNEQDTISNDNTHLDRDSLIKADNKVVDYASSKSLKCSDCKKNLLINREEFNLVLNKSVLYQGSTITYNHRREYSHNTYNSDSNALYYNTLTLNKNKSHLDSFEKDNAIHKHCKKHYSRIDKGKVNLKMYSSYDKIEKDSSLFTNNEIDHCLEEAFEIPKKEKVMKTEHSQIEILGCNYFLTEYSPNENNSKRDNKQNILCDSKENKNANDPNVNKIDYLNGNKVRTQPIQINNKFKQSPLMLKSNPKQKFKAAKGSEMIEHNEFASIDSNIDTNDFLLNSNYTKKELIKQGILEQSNTMKNYNNKNKVNKANTLNILNDSIEHQSELSLSKNDYINDLLTQTSQKGFNQNYDKPIITSSRFENYFKYTSMKSTFNSRGINNRDSFMTQNRPTSSNISQSNIIPDKCKHNKSFSSIIGSLNYLNKQMPLVSTNTTTKTFKGKATNTINVIEKNNPKRYFNTDCNSWIYPPNRIKKMKKYLMNMRLQTIHEYK